MTDNGIIRLHLTDEEKIAFLTSLGYKVKTETRRMGYPCYHNDMEYEDVKVFVVYKDGKEWQSPCGYSFGKTEWIDQMCEQELSKKLKRLLMA